MDITVELKRIEQEFTEKTARVAALGDEIEDLTKMQGKLEPVVSALKAERQSIQADVDQAKMNLEKARKEHAGVVASIAERKAERDRLEAKLVAAAKGFNDAVTAVR